MAGVGHRGARKLRNFSREWMTGEINDYVTNCQHFVWAMYNLAGVDWSGGMKGCRETGVIPVIGGTGWVGSQSWPKSTYGTC